MPGKTQATYLTRLLVYGSHRARRARIGLAAALLLALVAHGAPRAEAQSRSAVCYTDAGQYQVQMGLAALSWYQNQADTFGQLYKAMGHNDANAIGYLTAVSDALATTMAVEIKALKVAPVTSAQKRLAADLPRAFAGLSRMNAALRDVANGAGDTASASAAITAFSGLFARLHTDILAIEK